ncbi:MAG TPA: type II secretion system F family protein [Planctomicrobium sp.]|nr:type II secretion system F family protein [Planctomicrobium sp.]
MIVLTLFLAIGLTGIAVFARRRRYQEEAFRLLHLEEERATERGRFTLRPLIRSYPWVPWLLSILVGGILGGIGLAPLFTFVFAILVGLIGMQINSLIVQRRYNRLESQLADSISLMIAAVNVGASLQTALENALQESQRPLRILLDEVVGRIRYGDDPIDVMNGLRQRVPLETFHLFSTSLAINWRVGGGLAQTLAKVERTIRDRIETTRRVQAMTTQVRGSVMGVLLVTYFIAALVWRNNPDRMVAFLNSFVGQIAVVAAIGLQGIGIVWISWMSRPKF